MGFGNRQRGGGGAGQRIVVVAALHLDGIGTGVRGGNRNIGAVVCGRFFVAVYQLQISGKCSALRSLGLDGMGLLVIVYLCVFHGNRNVLGGDFHIDGQRLTAPGSSGGGIGGDGGRAHAGGDQLAVLNFDNIGIGRSPVRQSHAVNGGRSLGGTILHLDVSGSQLDPLGVVGLARSCRGDSLASEITVRIPAAKDAALLGGGCQSVGSKFGVRCKGAAVGDCKD